jgi:hypothetical protein
MPRLSCIVLIVALLLPGRRAFADDVPEDTEARARLEIGSERYRAGDYRAAAAEFRAAYAREPHPRLLYNWAQAERLAGNCEAAIPLYRKLVDSPLPDERRRIVGLHLAECVQTLEQAQPPSMPEPPPPPDAPQPDGAEPPAPEPPPAPPPERVETLPWHRDPLGTSLVASGVVCLGAGLGFYLQSEREIAAAEYAPHDGIEPRLDAARMHRTIAAVASVAGGGLLVAGVLRLALHDRTVRKAPAVSIAVGDGAYVTFAGSF